jgi:glyoxylase-like metal-dependent hydrolase (beta-lactamase superfamily II)
MTPSVEAYRTNAGARIYRLPLEPFPDLWGFAHLVFAGGLVVLVDSGSGFGDSNDQLEAGLAAVRRDHGEKADWKDLTHVVVTHGHIDHFGGLPYVRQHTSAPVGVHELDLRVLANYEERLTVVAHRLRAFLAEAGVSPTERETVMSLYLLNKHLFNSVAVDFTFRDNETTLGPLRLLHVPGHCPGQVVIQVDDILLSADHVLKEISPHQSPERLSLNTGLGHYLESLERMLAWVRPVRVTLGGHQGPIEDLAGRVAALRSLHAARLSRVLELLEWPHTIADVSRDLFPKVQGYHSLLALEEAGAHVEYLAQRGVLRIENLGDLETETPVPIRYCRLAGSLTPRPGQRTSATPAGEGAAGKMRA